SSTPPHEVGRWRRSRRRGRLALSGDLLLRRLGGHLASDLERALDERGRLFGAPVARHDDVPAHLVSGHRLEIQPALLLDHRDLVLGKAYEHVLPEDPAEHVPVHETRELPEHRLEGHCRLIRYDSRQRGLLLLAGLWHLHALRCGHRSAFFSFPLGSPRTRKLIPSLSKSSPYR